MKNLMAFAPGFAVLLLAMGGCTSEAPEFDRTALAKLTSEQSAAMSEFEARGLSTDVAEACVRLGAALGEGGDATELFSARYWFYRRYCVEATRGPSGWEDCYGGRISDIVENQATEACRSASLSMLFCLSDEARKEIADCDEFRPRESCDPTAPHEFIPMPEGFECNFRVDTYQISEDSVKQVIAANCYGSPGEVFELECDPPNDACTSACRCSKNAEEMRKMSIANVHGDEFLGQPLKSCEALAR